MPSIPVFKELRLERIKEEHLKVFQEPKSFRWCLIAFRCTMCSMEMCLSNQFLEGFSQKRDASPKNELASS